MYVITDKEKVVVAVSEEAGTVTLNEEKQCYERTEDENKAVGYIDVERDTIYPGLLDWSLTKTEALLPEDFSESYLRYCFTEEKGFYENPNWLPPEPTTEEKLNKMMADVDYIAMETGINL